MVEQQVTVRLVLDGSNELAVALDVAEAEPTVTAEVESQANGDVTAMIEPVTAILIGVGVLAAAHFIMEWWDRLRGGLIIDQRDGADREVYRDADVPWGWVIVFPKDGDKATIDTKDAPKGSIERLLGEIISGVLGSADAVKAAVKEILGSEKATAESAE